MKYNELSNLPDSYGDNRMKRILKFYGKLWQRQYNMPFKVSNWGLAGRVFNNQLKHLTEHQICALIIVHFNWRGHMNDDDFQLKRLASAGFPFAWITTSENNYSAYLQNMLGVDINNDEQVKQFIINNI